MRRWALVPVFVLLLAATWTAMAPAKTNRAEVRGVCPAQGMDVYFWPQGHPAIPLIGFPAFGPPHVEFYRPRDVSGGAQLAYMDVIQGQLAPTPRCTSVADVRMPFVTAAPTQTTTSTQKLRCTFTANVDLRIAPWTKVTTRVVTRLVKVKGKKKKRKVRRTIRQTVRIGELASIGVAGTPGAVAEVGLSTVSSTPSSMKWDTRVCTPVDVAG